MHILVLNTGSSSIKFALFNTNGGLTSNLRGSISHIGQGESYFSIQLYQQTANKKNIDAPDHRQALQHIVDWLKRENISIDAIGHRLVHGGPQHYLPTPITPQLISDIQQYTAFAPEHLPAALAGITAMQLHYPDIKQIACFDTAFHWHMPAVAQSLPLPTNITEQGIRKYGFHGLSYEYVYEQLQKTYPDIQQQKIVIAHLGNGASMVAIKDGKSIDTSMGFTPAGGLVMSSRTGDIDPGVVIYLLQHYKYTSEQLNDLLNHQSGLKGISGISGDMQTLQQSDSIKAQLAIDVFCYQAQKHLGALIAALGGIDVLVFTGGIGEASADIRIHICTNMQYAGIELNETLNKENSTVISSVDSKTTVHVIATDEEYTIAQHVTELIKPT